MQDVYSSDVANNIKIKYKGHNNIRGLYEVFITLALYFATLLGTYWAYKHQNWVLMLPFLFLNALSLVRIYILEHDCSHGSLFPFKVLNLWAGRLISIITLTPFYAWRSKHLGHHKIVSNIQTRSTHKLVRKDIGYVLFYTVSEYQKKDKKNQLLYKLMCNPFLYYLILAPLYFIVVNRFPIDTADYPEEYRKKYVHSVLLTNLAVIPYYALFLYFFGMQFLIVYLISLVLATAYGTFLFQVQHIFPETKFFANTDENVWNSVFITTSFYKLPRILDWFTCSIGYHHIHHLFPTIPGYNLKKCYEDNPILHTVNTVTMSDTLKIISLRLYDDIKLHRMLTWKDYFQHYSK